MQLIVHKKSMRGDSCSSHPLPAIAEYWKFCKTLLHNIS